MWCPFRLVVCDHLGERVLTLETWPYTVGSAGDCHCRLGGSQISPHHASILKRNGQYVLHSREWRYGTFLNDEQVVRECELLPGDRIRLGRGEGADLLFLTDQVVCLEVTLPNGETLRREVTAFPASVGRSECSVVILDASISPRHAVIHRRDGQFLIEDLASHTGVTVRGQRITEAAMVAFGDEIAFGACAATLVLEDGGEPRDSGGPPVAGHEPGERG